MFSNTTTTTKFIFTDGVGDISRGNSLDNVLTKAFNNKVIQHGGWGGLNGLQKKEIAKGYELSDIYEYKSAFILWLYFVTHNASKEISSKRTPRIDILGLNKNISTIINKVLKKNGINGNKNINNLVKISIRLNNIQDDIIKIGRALRSKELVNARETNYRYLINKLIKKMGYSRNFIDIINKIDEEPIINDFKREEYIDEFVPNTENNIEYYKIGKLTTGDYDNIIWSDSDFQDRFTRYMDDFPDEVEEDDVPLSVDKLLRLGAFRLLNTNKQDAARKVLDNIIKQRRVLAKGKVLANDLTSKINDFNKIIHEIFSDDKMALILIQVLSEIRKLFLVRRKRTANTDKMDSVFNLGVLRNAIYQVLIIQERKDENDCYFMGHDKLNKQHKNACK